MKQDIKTKLQHRLRRVEGQVRGLQKMVDEEQYCIDIITQTAAVRQALSAVEDALLLNHLSTHAVAQMKSGKSKQAVDEILRVYQVAKRK